MFCPIEHADTSTTEPLVRAAIEDAVQAHGRGVRLDSRRSANPRIDTQRVMIRHTAALMVRDAEARSGTRLDSREADHLRRDVEAAIADGLGLVVDGSVVRMDAAVHLPDDLLSSREPVVFPSAPDTVLTDAIGKRSVDAYAETVPTATGKRTGSFEEHSPAMDSAPILGWEVEEQRRTIKTFVAKTVTNWIELGQASASSINRVQEDAAAAREIWAEAREQMLVDGLGGGSFKGLVDLNVPVYASPVNYATAGIADVYADLIALVQTLASSAQKTNAPAPDSLWLGQRWVDQIVGKSNIAAGGSLSGVELLGRMAAQNEGLSMALRSAQIRRIVAAPALDSLGPGENFSGGVLLRSSDNRGLREIVAMELSPVRSASTLVGNEQLWAFRGAGLEWVRAEKQGLAYAQVA